jgi:serine protease Do
VADRMQKSTKKPGKSVNVPIPTFQFPSLVTPRRLFARFGAIVLILILIAFLAGYGGAQLANHHNDTDVLNTTEVNGQNKVVTSESQLISKIASKMSPSVVSVNVSIDAAQPTAPDSGFFTQPQSQSQQAAGTGIIISSSGLVITNRHVVPTGTTNVSVTLSDGTQLKNVSVIGRTNDNDSLDVAFLKINDTKGHKLTAAAVGDSAKVEVGDDVIAIGNALGQFQNTVTSGIISGFGRSVQASDSSASTAENLDNLFQTDAAINEGNSGGPLVNLNGQVIGINTATAGNAQNIGFAIPVNDVRGLIKQVLATGKFLRPYLGVYYMSLTEDVASSYGLKVNHGAFIIPSSNPDSPSVIPGSPADKAGLQERDIIVDVDGQKIDQSHGLTSLLAQHEPGDSVNMTILRGSETLHVRATIGVQPSQTSQQ